MSLDFDTKKIAKLADGSDPVRDKDGNLTGLCQTMVFMTMFVELGEITSSNVKEFYKRCFFYETECGAMRQTADGEYVYITEDEVRSFIGLKTNVVNKSWAQFRTALSKRVIQRLEEALERKHRK